MRRLILGLLLALAPATVSAQLVQSSDLVHEYSFTIPSVQDDAGNWCEYTTGVIAYNPANDSLFLVCHDWSESIAEVSIPSASGQASTLQSPRVAVDVSAVDPGDPNGFNIGGLLVDGDQLLVSAYAFYDSDHSASASHFVRSTDLSDGNVTGPFRVGDLNPAFYGGYFLDIPADWQGALGGDLMIGQCCLSIISRTSYGPAAFAVSRADLLAATDQTPAQPLLYYPQAHPTLNDWNETSEVYNGTTDLGGGVFVPGTSSVLYVGRQGIGEFCYGFGDECGDPTSPYKGDHAYPYRAQYWLYDANELADVAAGNRDPWSVVPYDYGQLPGVTGTRIGGAAYDQSSGRFFVTENFGDGAKPRIHVFTVAGGTLPPDPDPDPVDAVVGEWSAWVPITDWSVCDGGMQARTERRTREEISPAQNGGQSFPLVEERDVFQNCTVDAVEARLQALEAAVAGLASVPQDIVDLAAAVEQLQDMIVALPPPADTTALEQAIADLEARVEAWVNRPF